jgi:branched-chain amino acid transport system permease protein
MVGWLDTVLQGVLLGGLYALFAMGQSLLFGVMRLTNTAQGDLIVLAAFGAYSLTSAMGLSPAVGPWAAMVGLLPLAFAAGFALQRWVLQRTLGKDPLPSLVVTFGLGIVIQNVLLQVYTADPRSIESGALSTASVQVGQGVAVGGLPLLIFGIAVAMAVALQRLFHHTALGRAFRAVSDDPEAAALMGLDPRRVFALATGLALVLVTIAGTLHGMRTTVSPADGSALLLYSFEAVVIGGLGSFYGTLAGGIILGVTQDIGFRIDPGWGVWLGHVVFLAALLLRPQGLFPRTR